MERVGRLPRVAAGKSLTEEQNERVRALVRELLDRYESQTDLAPLLQVSQPTLSAFLGGRQGTSFHTARLAADLAKRDVMEVLGLRATPGEAPSAPLETLADRAWYAYHALPRSNGRLPAWSWLEAEAGLPEQLLSDVFSGGRRTLDEAKATAVAGVLGVSVEWLLQAKGAPPVPSGPVRQRVEKYPGTHESTVLQQLAQSVGTGIETPATIPPVKTMTNFELALEHIRQKNRELELRAREEITPEMSVEQCEAALKKAQQEIWREKAEAHVRSKKPAPTEHAPKRPKKAAS